ncbi:phosphopantetheine binding protein [Lachnotalea glycerini]|jgi:acyl carrier protein|uniref:Phosphopantetheine binding protein n=1 Tax=Lachnotalea glycerini TaxID=1763509 RepID=A0A318ERK9_9FIRM|nr:acyl carrier protein [Lachnotalea glycerini]PXV95591.1 phosphopantetheine binding protein [Lachnotalea glycerini]
MRGMEEIKEGIKNIIASKMTNSEKIKEFSYDTPLLLLGIDSILALAILVEIEETYDIEIDDGDLNMDKIRNVDNFASLVAEYLE